MRSTHGYQTAVRALSTLGLVVWLALAVLTATAERGVAQDQWPLALNGNDNVNVTAVKIFRTKPPQGSPEEPKTYIYVAGSFRGSANFQGKTLASKRYLAPINGKEHSEDVFVVRLDEKGTVLWANSAGGDLDDSVAGIDVDNSGNVYIAGNFCGGPRPRIFRDFRDFPQFSPSGPYDFLLDISECSISFPRSVSPIEAKSTTSFSSFEIATYCDGSNAAKQPFFDNWQQDIFFAKLRGSDGRWVFAETGGGTLADTATGVQLASDDGNNADVIITATTVGNLAFKGASYSAPNSVPRATNSDPGGKWCTPNATELRFKVNATGTGGQFTVIKIQPDEFHTGGTAQRLALARVPGTGRIYMAGLPNRSMVTDLQGSHTFNRAQRVGGIVAIRAPTPTAPGPTPTANNDVDEIFILGTALGESGVVDRGSNPLFPYGSPGQDNACFLVKLLHAGGSFGDTYELVSLAFDQPDPFVVGKVRCTAIAADESGGVYVTGYLESPANQVGTLHFRNVGQVGSGISILSEPGARSLFVAKITRDLVWEWALTGSAYPRFGSSQASPKVTSNALSVADPTILVAGQLAGNSGVSFEGSEHPRYLVADDFADGFVALALVFGVWPSGEVWTVGEAVTPPAGALPLQPLFTPPEAFYWSDKNKKLYPKYSLPSATIQWVRTAGSPPQYFPPVAAPINWPASPQTHVAGAPVDLQLPEGSYCSYSDRGTERAYACGDQHCAFTTAPCLDRKAKVCRGTSTTCTSNAGCPADKPCSVRPTAYDFTSILYPVADPLDPNPPLDPAAKVFKATRTEPGYSVLLYTANDANPGEQERLEVVQTVEPSPADLPVPVGSPVSPIYHSDPRGKSGWVLDPVARFYPAAYSRTDRTGRIIPVNTDANLTVAWYQPNAGGIAWPAANLTTELITSWAPNVDRVFIANQFGSDVSKCIAGSVQNPRDTICTTNADCGDNGVCRAQNSLIPPTYNGALEVYHQPNPKQDGYNPNEEHALLIASQRYGSDRQALYALRTDLNNAKYCAGAFNSAGLPNKSCSSDNDCGTDGPCVQSSEPYVLLKYIEKGDGLPADGLPALKVYKVSQSTGDPPAVDVQVTSKLPRPFPLNIPLLSAGCASTVAPTGEECVVDAGKDADDQKYGPYTGPQEFCAIQTTKACSRNSDCPSAGDRCVPSDQRSSTLCPWPRSYAAFRDFRDDLWARAPGPVKVGYAYKLQSDFYFPSWLTSPRDNCLRWPIRADGSQGYFSYNARWNLQGTINDLNLPQLQVGQTLVTSTRGLPDIKNQLAAQVAFETFAPSGPRPPNHHGVLVRLYDWKKEIGPVALGSTCPTVTLPPSLQKRVKCDGGFLTFEGQDSESLSGDSAILPNVMTPEERVTLTGFYGEPAIPQLYNLSRNPNRVMSGGMLSTDYLVGIGGDGLPNNIVGGVKALTAGKAERVGVVTLAFNNAPNLTSPVELKVIRVGCGPYQGQLQVVEPENVFDEQVTIRHNADFAGDPSGLDFKWYLAIKQTDCGSIPVPPLGQTPGSPWQQLPSGPGHMDVTLGARDGLTTLVDTCVMARYTGYSACGAGTSSQWAGAPFSTSQEENPQPQLVPGWLSRVTRRVNAFNQETDFRNSPVNTFSSAVRTAGKPYEGDVPLNPNSVSDPDSGGLFRVYQTVLNRGIKLSIDDPNVMGASDLEAVSSRLLDVAARVSDLYMLLGNEAFSDAQDPTIGFDSTRLFGTPPSLRAPVMFAFDGPFSDLLGEELALLRGIDDKSGPLSSPVWNRLKPNFTGGIGEIAYQQNYGVRDSTSDGHITGADAARLFPQGQGDAWGHYLSAVKSYYRLLRHPKFTWLARSDSVLVNGSSVKVDFKDERRFAAAAAARARAGAQIVDLTYRERWIDNPAGQWQGYKEANLDRDRAWGVSDWATRAAEGAYFDWVAANALLPPQSDRPPGIDKIDRTTVPELKEIVAHANEVVGHLELIDQGNNPLGLPKNMVPFDINKDEVGKVGGRTHFEQIYDRAKQAWRNAVDVFDQANQFSQLLRRNQDEDAKTDRNVEAQERDLNNRLIEIFGTPYPDDPAYPTGYEGPDIHNWDVADPSEIAGTDPDLLMQTTFTYSFDIITPDWAPCGSSREGQCRYDTNSKFQYNPDGSVVTVKVCRGGTRKGDKCATDNDCPGAGGECKLPQATIVLSNLGFGKLKPESWTRARKSPGELQLAHSEILQARAQFEQAVHRYAALNDATNCVLATIQGQNTKAQSEVSVINKQNATSNSFEAGILAANVAEIGLRRVSGTIKDLAQISADALPMSVGLSNDMFAPLRALTKLVGKGATAGFDLAGDVAQITQLSLARAEAVAAQKSDLELKGLDDDFQIFNLSGDLGAQTRRQPEIYSEAQGLAERVRQAVAKQKSILAKGVRTIDQLETLRKHTAGDVAANRYSDMAFRIFRNDALQKYRAQFDLAARYVYLAANAFDYETNLLRTDQDAGASFLTKIVQQRLIGEVSRQGNRFEPVTGRGLGGILAGMNDAFQNRLKSALQFDNPTQETTRFSLRREKFRVLPTQDADWRKVLADHRVENLWKLDNFKRFADSDASNPLPGIAIPFATTIAEKLNFFGNQASSGGALGGADSLFSINRLSTKVRSLGVWFKDYNSTELSPTPYVYLMPVGEDILRTRGAGKKPRFWRILDESIPGVSEGVSTETFSGLTWTPWLNSLREPFGRVRKFGDFRAYNDSGSIGSADLQYNSRAVGRSVANTQWLLVIPGNQLGEADPDVALDKLIYGKCIGSRGCSRGDGTGVLDSKGNQRDGKGISDILLFFETYAYQGAAS